MASQQNVELEAAKFLHKLIQDSTDEPAKLATKLYVILQHMKSSGKEHSMPYQVISRAMETVINQHGLDIEALKSSRLPSSGGTHVGDSSAARLAGSSSAAGVAKDTQAGLAENEMAKIDAFASSRPPVGPSSAGHDIYQGSVSHKSGGKSFDHESPSSLDTRSANSQSQERRDSANWEKQVNQKDSKKSNAKRKRTDPSPAMEPHVDNPNHPDTRNSVVNPRKGKLMNKVESPGSFSVKSGENTNLNIVQSTSQMEQFPISSGSMRSMLRAKQEGQSFMGKSMYSRHVSNPMPWVPNSNSLKKWEVSSSNNAVGLQQGGNLPSTQRHPLLQRIFMQQSTTPSLGSSAAAKIHGGMPSSYPVVEPGFSSSMQFSGSSYDNHALVAKMHKERNMEAFSAMNSSLLEASSGKNTVDAEQWKHGLMRSAVIGAPEKTIEAQMLSGNHGEEESKTLSIGKVLDHEGGTSNTSGNATKMAQGGGANMVTEMSMLRSATFRDAGKSPIPQALPFSGLPFKEQHLKQLRAQCLVFLAFRNNLLPKKLHLEIALGNIYPKEGGITDGPRKELIDHKGKDYSLNEPSNVPEVPVPFGRLSNVRDTERIPPGSSSSGSLLETDSMSKAGENTKIMEDNLTGIAEERRHILAMRRKPEADMHTQEVAESQAFPSTASQPDSSSIMGLSASPHEDNLESSHLQVGRANQASSLMGINRQIQPELINWTGIGNHNDASRGQLPVSAIQHEPLLERKDNTPSQSQSFGDTSVQGNQHSENHLSPFLLRDHWKPVSGMDNDHHKIFQTKEANLLIKHVSRDDSKVTEIQTRCISDGCKAVPIDDTTKNGYPYKMVEKSAEQGDEDRPMLVNLPPSPKCTTSEKWIMDQQKRRLHVEQNWLLKEQKTEKKIAACFEKLKGTVSSSEDISAKTKSVIELKKLQLLALQRRLRRDFLNDFFKPIAIELDRLKSFKKHRHGRRIKQLEKFEQKMKEERQKRIRERQKEFFSEIEVHKERLDDVFKFKRERWKSFSKYVKEFHKRKERIHREKIDRIQREKINLLKINDVEGYLRMVQDAKSDRVKQLLKETEKYLQKLGSKLQEAKSMTRHFEVDMDENRTANVVEKNETAVDNEDESDQAKHYLESNEKYYLMAHSIKESIAEQPTCLQGGKLREYQMNGLRWLVSLYNNHLNGILADEMGLGKTVQVIALICYLMETKNDRGPFLVVVPSSVLSGWESEINFWAPSVNKIVYSGPPEERRKLFKERIVHQKFNVLLTTYEYLMNKHDRPKLSKIHWHYIVIDEGHRIKNASCKLNADLKHYQSSHRLLLTGTPLQNNLEELWALLNFLLPNIFNSSEDFSQWFNKPFESNGDNSPDEALLSEEENLLIINRLHQVLRPFVLRRLKHKVENELPEKIERLVRCEASAYQKLLIKRVEENLGSIGSSKARSVHNSVMELRNICNHPYLSQLHADEVDNLIPKHFLPPVVRLCGKLEMLDRLLPKLKATDHRVLFFSTMTRLLDVMEEYLHWKQYRYLRLDGHTSGGDRGALIEQFNQPDSPYFIFLLSIRAGGVGVNLQAADTVIIFDTDWNPQVDLQAQARAHRIGQKRDVLVLRLETVQTVEEQVRASAEHKLGVANQSITAGFFDNNTSAEDRREYLESLLRESKKEEAMPVLDDDALNDLLARSESEIDIFESIDKKRQEAEMATWKKLVGQGMELTPPLPSRLVTDDDLKVFYQAMKIYEESNAGVISNVGVKRKGEYLGGLDTQQYGRGKRAREVRSYEEQWTEEEFEKLCQVDSPESPKLKEEMVETNLPIDSSGPVVATSNTESPAPAPAPAPAAPAPAPAPSPAPAPAPAPPPPPPPSAPSVEPPPQQSKEVTPPSRRGRGRPKRATLDISSAVDHPAPSGAEKLDTGSQKGNVSSFPTASGPHSFPGPTAVKGTSSSMHNVGVGVPAIPPQSLPPVPPGSESTVPDSSVPVQVKGQGRKAQSGGEGPRRRGKKQASVPPAVPDALAGQDPKLNEQSQNKLGDPKLNEPSQNKLGDPKLNEQSHNNTGDSVLTASSFPTTPGPDSVSASTTVKSISGTVQHFGVGIAPSSQAAPPLHLVASDSKSTPPCPPVVTQVKGQGRKTQSGAEAPRRRGRKQALLPPAVPGGLVGEEPANQGSQNKSGDLVGASSGTVSSLPVAPGPTPVSAVKVISGTMHHFGVGIAPSSQPVPPSPSVAPSSQSTPPCPTAPVRVKGQSQKAQSGAGAPRRRGKKQCPIPPGAPDSLAGQVPKSSEKVQSKSGDLLGSKAIAVGSEQEKDSRELANAIQQKACKIPTSNVLAGVDLKSTKQPDYSAQNKKPRISSTTDGIAGQDPKSNERLQYKSGDSLGDEAIALRTEQEETRELTTAIQEQASKGLDLKSTEESEYSAQNKKPRILPTTDSVAGEDPISNEKAQDKSGDSLGNQAIAMRSEQEKETKEVTNAIQEQASKVHSSDVLASTDLKSTEQSENPVQNKHPRSSSITESSADKDPELNEKLQDASGVLLGSQATASRSEQEKELTIAVQEQACNIHTSGVLVDMDLKSTEGSYCSAQYKMPASSPTTHDSAGQDPKSNEKLPDKSGYLLETKAISMTSEQENDSQELESTIQEQACKIHGSDVLAGQTLESTEQLNYSAENLKEASSSTTHDCAARLLEKVSVCLEVSEVDASLKSKEETLPTEIQACQNNVDHALESIQTADANDVASLTKKVTSEICSIETKFDVSFASEIGDAPTVSYKTLSEVTKKQSLEDETCSTMPTFVAATPVVDPPVDNDENPSGKEGNAEVEENEDAVLDEALVSKPEVSESHSKVSAGSTGNMTDSEKLIDVSSIMVSNRAVICTVPLRLETLETCSSDVKVDELFVREGGDAPNFPEPRLTFTDVTKNESPKDDRNSTILAFEKETPDWDVPVDRHKNQSGKDGDGEEQEDKDPPPVVALVSETEPEITADSVENMVFSSHLIEDNSIMGSNATNVVCKVSPRVYSSETCSSETKVGEPFGNDDGDAPIVPVSSKTVIEVNKNENLEDNSCSTMSTSESEAPVLDLPICNHENQCDDGDTPTVPVSRKTAAEGNKNQSLEDQMHSTMSSLEKAAPVLDLQICSYEKQCVKEGDAKEEEDKGHLLDQTIVSEAKACELESKTTAGSIETMIVAEQIIEEKRSMDEVPTVSSSVGLSETCSSETKISESIGAEGGDNPTLTVSCNTSIEVIKNQSLELKICSEITSEAGAPALDLPAENCESQSEKACIAEIERGNSPDVVDALILESKACEPESKITSGSVENMPESSQPIEKNSILGINVETICSDPLISGQVDDVSCQKSPARDGALVDLSVRASSIQMDSPLVSEDAAEFNDMAKNNLGNRSKPSSEESPKSSPLGIRSFDAPMSSVKTDDVGSPPVDSVVGLLPVDPDDSGICNLDGGVPDEDKLSMVPTEADQCSSKVMSEVAETALEADNIGAIPEVPPIDTASACETVTSHESSQDKCSPKSPCDGSEDKGKLTLEPMDSTIKVGNTELVSKDDGGVQPMAGVEFSESEHDGAHISIKPMAGVECSESEHDGAHNSKDLSETQASSPKVLFNSNDGVSNDFNAEIADPMDVGGVMVEQAPVLEPMHPVTAKSGNTECVPNDAAIEPVMGVESSKDDTDQVCHMDVNLVSPEVPKAELNDPMDVTEAVVMAENIDPQLSLLETQVEETKSSSENGPDGNSSSLEMLEEKMEPSSEKGIVESSSSMETQEENIRDSSEKDLNASLSSLETREEKIEGSSEKDLAGRSPSLETQEEKIEGTAGKDPLEKSSALEVEEGKIEASPEKDPVGPERKD